MIGAKIGNYEILEKLGQGGMGAVYKARDLRLRRLVALKFLSDGQAGDAARSRFLREAQIASALNHPHIVAIYDIGEHDGEGYIVMEYVEGSPLGKMIPEHGLPAKDALDLLAQLADALSAAHRAGVVHRDLKPGNVMVDRAGRVKVLDFGLAKFTFAPAPDETLDVTLTRVGAFVGTIHYCSPEQAGGGQLDHRSDIFSFGVMAQEMLTGIRPFTGESQWAVLHGIAHGNPRRLRETHPHLPPSLEDLIGRMLAKRPADRIGGMGEVLARLREIRGGVEDLPPTEILPPSSSVAQAVPAATEKPSIAVMMFRSVSPDKEDEYIAEGIATEVARALSGVPGVRVVSQLASFRVKAGMGDLPWVARSLNARYVLTGSVRRSGNRMRVIAELADAAAGIQIWSQKYDRSVEDLFAVQDEIAQAIVAATGGQIIRTRNRELSQTPAETLDVFGLIRKAYNFTIEAYHKEGLDNAVALLRQAVLLDPNCALAHAILGFMLIQRVVTNSSENIEQDRAEALAEAENASLAAPGDAEVLENAGLVQLHCGKFERSLSALRRAVELAPFNFTAWGYLVLALGWAGNAEQLREAYAILHRIMEQAPNHPSLPYWLCFRAGILAGEGKHEEAAEAARRGVTLQPRFAPGLAALANALGYLGRFDEARELAMRMAAANPNANQKAYMTELLIITGSPERAQTHIGGLIAAGIFRGDLPWPTLANQDTASRRPISA